MEINKKSLKAQAYNYLKDCIISGQFEHDKVYTEMSLAKKLEISRTPIREAVLQLAHDDFVELKPNKGFVVKSYSIRELRDYLDLRKAIEGFCGMHTVISKGSAKWKKLIADLEENLESLEAELQRKHDPVAFMRIDAEFHFIIIDYVGNVQMTRIMHDLRDKIDRVGIESEQSKDRCEETLAEHRAIVKAIKSGDSNNIYHAFSHHFDKCFEAMACVHGDNSQAHSEKCTVMKR